MDLHLLGDLLLLSWLYALHVRINRLREDLTTRWDKDMTNFDKRVGWLEDDVRIRRGGK